MLKKQAKPLFGQVTGLSALGRNGRHSFKLAIMAAAAMPTVVAAQENVVQAVPDSTIIVTPDSSRQDAPTPAKPDLEAAPKTSNSFNVTADVGTEYNDNIYATRNDEVDDILITFRPGASFSWGDQKNRITFSGSGAIGRYIDNETENYDDWQVGMNGRAQLSSDITLVAGGDYQWDHENRASPEAVNGIEPTQYERAYGFAGLLLQAKPITARLVGTVNDFDFDDVDSLTGTINNDDRDRTHYEIGTRIGYPLGTGSEIFVQGAYDKREYDQTVDDFGYTRYSDGFTLAVGARHKLSNRLTGELFVGYLQQDYRDIRFDDISTIDFGAVVDWSGPRGLSASFRVDRSVEETTLPGASSYMLTSGNFSIRANPHPRLAAGLGLRGSHYDYRGVDRSESVLSANLWTRYYLNKHLYVGTDYTFAERSSNAAGYDYDQNRFMFRIGAQLEPHHSDAVAPITIGAPAPGGGYVALTMAHGSLITGLDGPRGSGGSNTADFGDAGLSYGAVAGYGMLIDSLYLGIEAQGQLDGPDWLHSASRVFSVEQKNSFGISGRLGYADEGGNLAYVRTGLTSTNFRTTYNHDASSFVNSDRMTGLEIGLGIDAKAGNRGFIRMEYAVSSYDDTDIPTGNGNFDNFSTTRNQFLVGGGIRFGAKSEEKDDVPPTDFSGFYVGAQFGHGTLTSDNDGTRTGGTAIDIQRASQGPAVGLFAGVGFVYSGFYIGGEVDADISNINWNIERDPTGRVYAAEHEYSFGARARLGYQISEAALLYGHVGAVRTRFNIPDGSAVEIVRSEETQTGLRYGAGMDIGLGKHARLRLDYSITDYQDYEVLIRDSIDGFNHKENLFRFGLAWKL
ncbi:outer membrane beta-barrel protein [Parasphingorhabdus sp.]|uniref:outer membrane beta-barrel protein n=1 Tax=Parasphingorhabdus sp. TaxID=2709688 RepID=UPI002F940CAE